MAIEGPLKELGIHDVFQLLDLSRKTGVLAITSTLRHNQGTVYFDGGAVVYAVIQSNPHPLGELLLRAGKITEADLHRARDMQQQGDERRLGEILIEMGAASQRELERQVSFQVEEVIFEVMNWREGYFSFVEGPLQDVPADATVRISTESLLMEGARRIDEWSRIEPKSPHMGVVPDLVPAAGGDHGGLDLLPAEWEVLAAVDGDRDLRAIAEALGRSDFDIAKTVFGLESAGLIAIGGGRPAAGRLASEGEDLEEMLQRAATALDGGDVASAQAWVDSAHARFPHEPSVYVLLGYLSLLGNQPPEAEQHLRRALRLDPLMAPAHRLLGDALARQGRFGEAIEWWQRWLKIGEQSEENPEELQRVREAVQAAEALGTLLRGPNG